MASDEFILSSLLELSIRGGGEKYAPAEDIAVLQDYVEKFGVYVLSEDARKIQRKKEVKLKKELRKRRRKRSNTEVLPRHDEKMPVMNCDEDNRIREVTMALQKERNRIGENCCTPELQLSDGESHNPCLPSTPELLASGSNDIAIRKNHNIIMNELFDDSGNESPEADVMSESDSDTVSTFSDVSMLSDGGEEDEDYLSEEVDNIDSEETSSRHDSEEEDIVHVDESQFILAKMKKYR